MGFPKNLLYLLLFNIGCVSTPEPLELQPTKNFLEGRELPKRLPPRIVRELSFEEKARKWMDNHTGIVENPPNSNRGKFIDEWNKMAGVPVGSFWCGSAAGAFVIAMKGTPPKGYAWTPNWAVKSRKQKEPSIGDIATFYFPRKKRIAHVGVHYESRGLSEIIWEGNGNDTGSRNGDKTVKKQRPKNTIEGFYDWIDND